MTDRAPENAASIPYEGTDCTPEEAVEAVKAVRAAACCEVHGLGKCDAVFTCCDKCPTFFGTTPSKSGYLQVDQGKPEGKPL